MASVLRHPAVSSERLLDASDPLLVDPAWQEMLDEATARARAEGYEEGVAAAAEAGRREAAAAGDALRSAVDAAIADGERRRSEWAGEVVSTSVRLLEHLVGDLEVDHDHLVSRLDAALSELDGSRLEVRVAPAQTEIVRSALADDPRVEVAADPALASGEARIRGEWCDADLTWPTVLEVLREALGA